MHPVEREARDELLEGEHLLLGARGPAQQRHRVDEGGGQVAELAILKDVPRSAALAQLLAVLAEHHRHMGEARGLPAERPVETEVLGGRGDPLLGPDDVAHLHGVVVDDVRQVVGGVPVSLEQDLVVDLGVVEGDRAPDEVLPLGPAGRDELAEHGRGSRLDLGGDLLPAFQATTVVAGGASGRPLPGTHLLEPRRRAGAPVGGADLDQPVGLEPVEVGAERLDVRIVGSPDLGALVPVQAQPAQVFERRLRGLLRGSLEVGILNPEHEGPT